MEKRMKFVQGMTGLLSVSALAFGLAGNAVAATLAPAAGGGIASYISSNGGMGVFAPAAAINITYSRHNLGTTNKLGGNHTAGSAGAGPNGTSVVDNIGSIVGTNQICVFCHTPHGFNAVQSGPLWNKAVTASASYAVYNSTGAKNKSSTLDADPPSIGSVSLACLSCHDGTQAMDNMINGPGSGAMASPGYDGSLSSVNASEFYTGTANGGVSQAYNWEGFSQMGSGGAMFGSAADNAAAEGILIGTDLSNDHPISMQYCGGGIFEATNTTGTQIANGTCRDRLFNLPTVATLNGAVRFWVDVNTIQDSDAVAVGAASTGGITSNPITRNPDTLALYVTTGETLATLNANSASAVGVSVGNQTSAMCGIGNAGDGCGRGFIAAVNAAPTGSGTGYTINKVPGFGIRTKQDIMLFTNNTGVTGPSVECASCHDPHTPNNGTFLRVSNQGSGLCLSCHVK